MAAQLLETTQNFSFLDEDEDQQEENGHGCFTCSSTEAVKLTSDITKGCHLARKEKLSCSSEHFLCVDIKFISNKRAKMTAIQFAKGDGKHKSVHKKNIEIDLHSADYNIIVYKKPKFTKEQIIERAENLLKDGILKNPNAFENNKTSSKDPSETLNFESSKHFVDFCCTGYDLSNQITEKQTVAKRATKLLASLPSILIKFFCKAGKMTKLIISSCVDTIMSLPLIAWHVYEYIKNKKSKSFCQCCKTEKVQSSRNSIIALIVGTAVSVLFSFCPFGFIVGMIVGGAITAFLERKTISDFFKSLLNPDYTTEQVNNWSQEM